MDAAQLKMALRDLPLSPGSYVVFGGGCLTLRGLRTLQDIDLFITPRLYKQLATLGWKQQSEHDRKSYLVYEIHGTAIQAFDVWEGDGWQPDIHAYLKKPELVDGVPCMPLKELYAWKQAVRRAKDVEDIELIERHWTVGKI